MKKQPPPTHGDASNGFVHKHAAQLTGILRGFDRVRIRGTLRSLYHPKVMEAYLQVKQLLWKDFKAFATDLTGRIKLAAIKLAESRGRPYVYLPSTNLRKETLAREIAERDGVREGLIAVFGCVEPCRTYFMRGNRATQKLELKLQSGKCQHLYFYQRHPVLGFMHVRLQSWFPFQVQMCINGREWLSRQLDLYQIPYRRQENCFTWIGHVAGAQRLMDKQLETRWPDLLGGILREYHPLLREICQPLGSEYYWSAESSEYATDLMFKSPADLAEIYLGLARHAICNFSSPDVLRFLGRNVPVTGVHKNFQGEVLSEYRIRPEGVRVKHTAESNSIKIYDKQGSVLRIETTINQPRGFRVYRTAENQPQGKKAWRILRRTLADLPRRAQISHAANERYLQALSAVDSTVPLYQWTKQLCQPLRRDGQRYRALNPWSPKDKALLEAVNRGEFAINGFRNRDLRPLLYPTKVPTAELKRRAAAITRQLRLLRAHGLIKKISGTHRYVLTPKGRASITALLTAHQADAQQLAKLAA